MATKPTLDPEVERDPVAIEDLEDAVGQVLLAPAEDRPESENREPLKEELSQRWKMARRNRLKRTL